MYGILLNKSTLKDNLGTTGKILKFGTITGGYWGNNIISDRYDNDIKIFKNLFFKLCLIKYLRTDYLNTSRWRDHLYPP